MPTNTLLSIRPEYELVTRYGAAWMTPILNASGMPVIDLYKENATRSNFENAISTRDPILVNIMGHGNYNLIACQNGAVLLQGGINTNILAGRVVYDLSCESGRDLGATAVNEGAISFLGYTEDFFIVLTEGSASDGGMINPLDDEVAKAFFKSHNSAPISFLQGSTISASYSSSQNTFNYWINIWEQIDSQVAAALMWNRDCQILHGGEVSPPVGGKISPLLMFLPLLLIPMLSKKKNKKL